MSGVNSGNAITLVIDESGARGFAENEEQYSRQIGLVAGVIIRNEVLADVTEQVEALVAEFPIEEAEKLHITDLDEEQSERLRGNIFSLIQANNLICVYEAISVQGFHQGTGPGRELQERANAAIPDGVFPQGNPPPERPRLHSEQASVACLKALAWCSDTFGAGARVEVSIRTDNIEQLLVDEFATEINNLINAGEESREQRQFYDTNSGQQVARTTQVTPDVDNIFSTEFQNMNWNIEVDESDLPLLADVVANSLYDYIERRFRNGEIQSLNSPESIAGHPLESNVYGVQHGSWSDGFFGHPDTDNDNPNDEEE